MPKNRRKWGQKRPFWPVFGGLDPSDGVRGSKNAKNRKKSKITINYGLRGIGNDGPAPPVRAPEPHCEWQKSGYQGPVFDVFRGSNGGRVHTADIRHTHTRCSAGPSAAQHLISAVSQRLTGPFWPFGTAARAPMPRDRRGRRGQCARTRWRLRERAEGRKQARKRDF